jgi:hypothetical protein
MNWLHYLAEANIYLGVFYLAYCVFLTKETHYQLNRGYLLFSCIISFVLPVLQVGALKPAEPVAVSTSYIVPQDYIPAYKTTATVTPIVIEEHHLTLQDYLWYAYIIGAGILLIVLIIKLYTLFKLMRNAQRIKQDKYKLVYLPETDVAFSFFNYLFIGNNAPGANTIITHELVHIRQRHSLDIIFLEFLKVVSWFNPFIYLLQNSLKTVHEYIADEQTATSENDALTYSTFLVNNAYGAGGSSITHSFFNYNLLKKRIIMLNQQRSGSTTRLKYLLALPLCAGLLCVSTLAFSKTYGWVDIDPAKAVKVDAIKPSPQIPVKPAAFKFPPQIVKPDIKDVHPPFTNKDKHGGTVSAFRVHNVLMDLTSGGIKYQRPIIIINGKRFEFNKQQETQLNAGALISTTADSMITYPKGSEYARSKWGKEAENTAVMLLFGDAFVKVVSEGQKPQWASDGLFAPYDKFLNYLVSNIKYPEDALNDGLQIFARTSFVVNNHKITDVTVVKGRVADLIIAGSTGAGPSVDEIPQSFQTDIAKALQNAPLIDMPSGKYSFPIACFLSKEQHPNYIGECNQASVHGMVIEEKGIVIRAVRKGGQPSSIEKTDTLSRLNQSDFLRDLARNVKYAAVDRIARNKGKVIALFAVDADHKIQYIKVVRTPSLLMSAEVIRSLKINKYLSILKPGVQYVVPVEFTLDSEDGSTVQPPNPIPADTKPDLSKNIYNPNNLDLPDVTLKSLMLNDVVIRGYIKKQ